MLEAACIAAKGSAETAVNKFAIMYADDVDYSDLSVIIARFNRLE